MPARSHRFTAELEWTGNTGVGTTDYRSYRRSHAIRAPGKPEIGGSSAPVFRGEADRYDPEELLVASLAACHMLWYLHLAAVGGVTVVAYTDAPVGTLREDDDGGGQFTEVVLSPRVRIARGDPAHARALHAEAHAKCFVARSVNFPVRCEPTIEIASAEASTATATARGST